MAGTATVGLAPPLQKHKIVFLGDQSVGKTSIIKHFIYGSYEHTYQATIGIDFFSKTVYLDDRTVRLQLWDTAGQERFRSLIPSYIRDSSVAVITYDITSRQSFTNSTQWMDDVRAERGSDVVIMLVGNKTDLSGSRKVSIEDGQALAKEQGVLFAECSAKEGHHIKHVFKTLAAALPDPATAPVPTDTQMIDVKLNPNASGGSGGGGNAADGGCGNC